MEQLSGIDYVEIGRRVRERRRDMRLTQERLAEQVGVSISFIGHIERAEKIASIETMTKIARALNVSMDYLICGIRQHCERESCPLYRDIGDVLQAYGIVKTR